MLITEAYIVPPTFEISQSSVLLETNARVVRLQLQGYGTMSVETRIPAAAGESEVVTTVTLSLLNYDEMQQVVRLQGAFTLLLRTPKDRWYALGLFPCAPLQIEAAEQTTGEAHTSDRVTLTLQDAPEAVRFNK